LTRRRTGFAVVGWALDQCQAGEAGLNLPTGTEGIAPESRLFGWFDTEVY
jgi:hypothetical protein